MSTTYRTPSTAYQPLSVTLQPPVNPHQPPLEQQKKLDTPTPFQKISNHRREPPFLAGVTSQQDQLQQITAERILSVVPQKAGDENSTVFPIETSFQTIYRI